MNTGTLIARSLRFHWRAHLGVLLGATLSAAILVGALAVGDSVRYSLRSMALARIGGVHLALNGQSRFFRAQLADDIAPELNAPVAPVILLRGTATGQKADGSAPETRVGRVQVVGVNEGFWKLSTDAHAPAFASQDGVILNTRLAAELNLKVGDETVLRVDKPSLLSRDAPLSTVEDASVTLRLPVTGIVADADFGRFSLESNQIPPYNAFVPLETLQRTVGMQARVNVLLIGASAGKEITPSDATRALWRHWQFADSSLDLRELPKFNALDLRTESVFLPPPVADVAVRAMPGAQGVLTYFVNELRVGDRTTPYSTVSALQSRLIPPGMQDNETLINRWLADDLHAKVGDELKLTYWLVGPMRRLELHSSVFRIRAILPMDGPAADPDLMPNIPGLSDKKNCRDWEPGVPIDLNKIRDKDQQYWTNYRGTPKAFITLHAGQHIWNNRFGNLTSVRYPMNGAASRGAVESCLRQALNPASLGFFFQPVRAQALAASSQSLDFGQLFLGFSFFLIVAALLLTVLLFAFGVEQRAEEVGTLLAVGFPPRRVQRLLLLEGGALALIASVLGAGLGVLYTRAVIRGLSTVWSGAVANSSLQYHAEPMTLIGGALAGFVVALAAIWLVTRKQGRAPVRELLAAGTESESRLLASSARPAKSRRLLPGLPTAIVTLAGAAALALMGKGQSSEEAAETFFSAGALLLIGGLALCRALLARMERSASAQTLTVGSLGVRNSVRRRGRSLSAMALLACGSFLVLAIGASRKDPNEGVQRRSSGTGGFTLYGETTLPVYQDLNTAEGRDTYSLDAQALQGVEFVPIRLREGDEASCLNLNRAQVPRLLGVQTDALRNRAAFTFTSTVDKPDSKSGWSLLDRTETDGAIPVVGDSNTVTWSLGKSLGATLPYTDDHGATLKLRIVGVLANSILQGGLVMSETNFVKHFPSQSGYQVFLIDAPLASSQGGAGAVSRELLRGLQDVGLNLTPSSERLAAFNAVENTYLSIFAILGGFGLLLGSLGLGVVVLRNVLERRGELALLRAVGFRTRALHWLVFSEHSLLLFLGLLVGIVAALLAILPALRAPGTDIPFFSLTLTLAAVLLSGFVWTGLATLFALRGPLLSALRNE